MERETKNKTKIKLTFNEKMEHAVPVCLAYRDGALDDGCGAVRGIVGGARHGLKRRGCGALAVCLARHDGARATIPVAMSILSLHARDRSVVPTAEKERERETKAARTVSSETTSGGRGDDGAGEDG